MKLLLKQNILLIPFIGMIALGCDEEFQMKYDTPPEKLLVVNGRLTNELKQHEILLTFSDTVDNGKALPQVREASVYLINETSYDSIGLSLRDDSTGIYVTPEYAGEVGSQYSLNVLVNNKHYQGTSTIYPVTTIDSVFYKYQTITFDKDYGFYIIRMGAQEPPEFGNHYRFNAYLDDSLYNSKMELLAYSDDMLINGIYLDTIDIYAIPQEEFTKDSVLVRLEMQSISEEEYEFINIFLAEAVYSGSPFSGPPANIPSNMHCLNNEDEFVFGFFAASAVSKAEVIVTPDVNEVPDDPEYER